MSREFFLFFFLSLLTLKLVLRVEGIEATFLNLRLR